MFNEEFHLEQPIRWGMVGGGRGSQNGGQLLKAEQQQFSAHEHSSFLHVARGRPGQTVSAGPAQRRA